MFAQRLEVERQALLLSPDVWMARIVGDGYDAERRQAVKAVQLGFGRTHPELRTGTLSFEFGFFSQEERDDARARAKAVGAMAHLIFLDPPFVELLRRLEARNSKLPEGHLSCIERTFGAVCYVAGKTGGRRAALVRIFKLRHYLAAPSTLVVPKKAGHLAPRSVLCPPPRRLASPCG